MESRLPVKTDRAKSQIRRPTDMSAIDHNRLPTVDA